MRITGWNKPDESNPHTYRIFSSGGVPVECPHCSYLFDNRDNRTECPDPSCGYDSAKYAACVARREDEPVVQAFWATVDPRPTIQIASNKPQNYTVVIPEGIEVSVVTGATTTRFRREGDALVAAESPWRDVATDPPPDGTRILAGYLGGFVQIFTYFADKKHLMATIVELDGDLVVVVPLKWMPLPEVPK